MSTGEEEAPSWRSRRGATWWKGAPRFASAWSSAERAREVTSAGAGAVGVAVAAGSGAALSGAAGVAVALLGGRWTSLLVETQYESASDAGARLCGAAVAERIEAARATRRKGAATMVTEGRGWWLCSRRRGEGRVDEGGEVDGRPKAQPEVVAGGERETETGSATRAGRTGRQKEAASDQRCE